MRSLIFLLLLPGSLFAQPGEELGHWEYIQGDKITESVCMLRPMNRQWYGSAVVIGPNRAITAAHCVLKTFTDWKNRKVEKAVTIEIWANNRWYRGRVTKYDKEADLAEIEFKETLPVDPIDIGTSFQSGDVYQHIGYAGQGEARHFYTKHEDAQNGYDLYEGNVVQGDSGGAILDENDRLVGVISLGQGIVGELDGALVLETCGAVSLDTIRRFLELDAS